MVFQRRLSARIRSLFLVLAALVAGLPIADAQQYPTKPIRVVVPFAAGSVPDVVTRLPAEKMAIGLGQPLIIENRVGAGGRIAAEFVAKQAPDGYTLVLGTASTHVVGPLLVKAMPYDPVKDFTPVSLAVSPVSGFVISGTIAANSVKEFVVYAKANPGKVAWGSNGIGSSSHLVGELINMTAGIQMLHVPYQGSNEALNALLANQVQVSFTSPGSVAQHLPAGRVKLLAILPGQRFAGTPNTPTLAEALPGYESVTDWFGFFGPAQLPPPIVARLHSEIVKGLNAPDVRAKLETQTMLVIGSTPEEFAALMKREAPIFARVVKAANIPMQ